MYDPVTKSYLPDPNTRKGLEKDALTLTAELAPVIGPSGVLPATVALAGDIGMSNIGRTIYKGINAMSPGSAEWAGLSNAGKWAVGIADTGLAASTMSDYYNEPTAENGVYSLLGLSPYLAPLLKMANVNPNVWRYIMKPVRYARKKAHDVYNYVRAPWAYGDAYEKAYEIYMEALHKLSAAEQLASKAAVPSRSVKPRVTSAIKLTPEGASRIGQRAVNTGNAERFTVDNDGTLHLFKTDTGKKTVDFGKSGEYSIVDFNTGKTVSGTVENPVHNGGYKEYVFRSGRGYEDNFPLVVSGTVSGMPAVHGDLSGVMSRNIRYVKDRIAGFKPFGSSVGVAENGIAHISHDIDGFMTKEDLVQYAKTHPVAKRPKGDTGWSHRDVESHKVADIDDDTPTYITSIDGGKFGQDGMIDINVINIGSDGRPMNKRTLEVYRQFFPEEYQKQVMELSVNPPVTGRQIGDFRIIDGNGKILTNKQLLDSFTPMEKTIMDSMEIDFTKAGKDKHMARIFGYLIGNNPDQFGNALKKTSRMQFGKKWKLMPRMGFDDFANRRDEVVGALVDLGYDESVAKLVFEKAASTGNEKYLQNAIDFAYVSQEKFFRAVNSGDYHGGNQSIDNLVRNSTVWNPVAGGGTASGPGLNATQGAPSGFSRAVNVLMQPQVENIHDGQDFAAAVKEMLRQNRPLGPIDDATKQRVFDATGIKAGTFQELASRIPNNDKTLFSKAVDAAGVNMLTRGQDYAENALFSGMRDMTKP